MPTHDPTDRALAPVDDVQPRATEEESDAYEATEEATVLHEDAVARALSADG